MTGMTRDDGWDPRPYPNGTKFDRAAYMCGYTDGFYGETFGAHDKGRYGTFSSYRTGFSHGVREKLAAACTQPLKHTLHRNGA